MKERNLSSSKRDLSQTIVGTDREVIDSSARCDQDPSSKGCKGTRGLRCAPSVVGGEQRANGRRNYLLPEGKIRYQRRAFRCREKQKRGLEKQTGGQTGGKLVQVEGRASANSPKKVKRQEFPGMGGRGTQRLAWWLPTGQRACAVP